MVLSQAPVGKLRHALPRLAHLAQSRHRSEALVPASPWLDSLTPPPPTITIGLRSVQITPGAGEAARWWYVRTHSSAGWKTLVVFADTRSVATDIDADRILVNAVNQAGNASAAVEWRR